MTTLKAIRHRAHLTQAELARRVGVGRDTIARWESGEGCPRRVGHLFALSEALGCSFDEIAKLMKKRKLPRREKLIKLRQNAGLTQAELAEEVFVSQAMISKWERGISRPNPFDYIQIAAALGCTVEEVVEAAGLQEDDSDIFLE